MTLDLRCIASNLWPTKYDILTQILRPDIKDTMQRMMGIESKSILILRQVTMHGWCNTMQGLVLYYEPAFTFISKQS